MTRLTWNNNKCNNVLILSVIISVISQQYVFAYPSNIKDATAVTPVRNLSDMDEDLITDADAEFESRKIEHVVAVDPQHEPISDSQNFFPSFSSIFSNHPLGHSRPPIFDDPPINNHRPRHIPYALQQANSFQGPTGTAYNSYQASQPKSSVAAATDSNVLGSGNFGVIRGGTFYEDDYDNNDDYFYPYNSNNGHGRPTNNYYNHQPAHSSNNNGDFFANFRDFADITAPKSAAYSEFHIIYVNKNGTEVHVNNDDDDVKNLNTKPRNIFEQLTKLDESESKLKLKKKGINSKEKLALHKEKENDKLYKKKQNLSSVKEIYHEPLLALS